MDIRQLRYFTVIAEEGQISLAAKKLNMAQPPLSQQLQLMEEELGVKLVERKRNGKRMELTEAGRVFYEKAQSVLHLFRESIKEVKEIGEGLKGRYQLVSYHPVFPISPIEFNVSIKGILWFHLKYGEGIHMKLENT